MKGKFVELFKQYDSRSGIRWSDLCCRFFESLNIVFSNLEKVVR